MTDAPPPPARNPLGWIALGLLFAYLIFGAVGRPNSDQPQDRIERYTSRLQSALSAYATGDSPFAGILSGKAPDEPLRELEHDVAARRRTEAIEAGFWAVIRKHLGEPVTDADLAPLARDKNYAILAEANRTAKRSSAEAKSLAAQLNRRGAASRLAADHVLREAGLRVPRSPFAYAKQIGAGLLVMGLLVACGLAWTLAVVLLVTGTLRWPGPAMEASSNGEADELALRATTLLTAFLALSFVARIFVQYGLDSRAGQALAYGGMLVVVPVTLRSRPSMAAVGFSTQDFVRNVGLGLWFFLLELPITGGVALVATVLLKNLPQPEHPASTALMSAPDLWTVLVTFFGGAIVAPFWEETMFRGLLFPAFRRVLRGPIPAALASSFLFASIHPQGPVLWASLATVALFSCFLVQKSRSLVPSVAMHFAHNAALLGITVLMSRG